MIKNILVSCILLLCMQVTFGQVGIGTTSPNNNAVLDIGSSNKGLLIPRVALTGTANTAPLSAHVAGMIVYNTATTGNVTPGFYINDGSKWVVSGNSLSSRWVNIPSSSKIELYSLSDGITPRTSGTEVVIEDTGDMGIGVSNPTAKLHVDGSVKLENLSSQASVNIENDGDDRLLITDANKNVKEISKEVLLSNIELGTDLDIGTIAVKDTFDICNVANSQNIFRIELQTNRNGAARCMYADLMITVGDSPRIQALNHISNCNSGAPSITNTSGNTWDVCVGSSCVEVILNLTGTPSNRSFSVQGTAWSAVSYKVSCIR